MPSILQTLDSKELLNEEQKKVKLTTDSKFKRYRKTQEDNIHSILRNEKKKEDDEPLDPYSKERSTRKPSKSRVMSLANSSYQNTLLEKILQSQNNPEALANELKFREKTVSLLTEMRDILKEQHDARQRIEEDYEDEKEYRREISTLAKNIAQFNVKGVMGDLTKGGRSSVDKYGLMDFASSMKEVVKETLSSGALGDMIKDQLQDSVLGMLGNKNKTIIKSFKEDPLSAIQDFINSGALGNNKGLRTILAPFYKGLKIDPIIKSKNKDLKAQAVFDNRSHTTLNVVIPDILSKMLSVQERGEQRKYNYDKDKWETVGQIIDRDSRGKETVEKYTHDLISYFKEAIVESMEFNPTGTAANAILKEADGSVKKNTQNQAILANDSAFIQVVKNIAMSPLSMTDIVNSGNLGGVVSKFNLAKGTDQAEAIIALNIIKEGLKHGKTYEEVAGESRDFEERKGDLRYIEDNMSLLDLTKQEANLYKKLSKGLINKKQFDIEMAKLKGGPTGGSGGGSNGSKGTQKPHKEKIPTSVEVMAQVDKNRKFVDEDKYLFGTTNQQRADYNINSRGKPLTKEEKRIENIDSLYNAGLISPEDYKSLQMNKDDKDLRIRVEKQSKKLVAAKALFSKFLQIGATADKMAELTGESTAALRRRGYFMSPEEIIPYLNEDGEFDSTKHQIFTKEYMVDVDRQVRKNRSTSFDVDMANPTESVGKMLDDVFTDPKLVKKLGIGSGSAAGYALGKLINNHTFIKSPKLGYLLGAIGGGIMSMERTQEYLTQTFGPTGGGDAGYSNREILVAKLLNRWLPAVGVGGKAAKITMKMMSGLGPAGKVLGPVAGLAIGGLVGGTTPWLLDKAKERMFNNDPTDKGVWKKLGNALRGIPIIDEYFASKDGREDSQVFNDTVKKHIKEISARIEELDGKKKKTDAEVSELSTLTEYRKGLYKVDKINHNISNIGDTDKKDSEFHTLYHDNILVTGDERLKQRYQEELNKRDRKNELGDPSKAKFKYRSSDEITTGWAKRELEKYSSMDISKLNPKEKARYDAIKSLANDGSINDEMHDRVSEYLDQNKELIDELAESVIEDETLVSLVGSSSLRGRVDKDGKEIKGLDGVETQEEFDEWLSSQPKDAKEYIFNYMSKRQRLTEVRDHLRDLAEMKVSANYPTLKGVGRNRAIEEEINRALLSRDNLGKTIRNKTGQKIGDIQNKIINFLGEGGTTEDDLIENQKYLDKLEAFLGGGKGTTDVNSIIKMKDLKKYKFKNGSRLSVAGCSIVALNNALNHLGIGGISIEYLLGYANQYLSSDGGVTSNFFRSISEEINLVFKTYNSMDNNFDNELLAKFKPTKTKAVILLLRNPQGGGSHYVNVTSINSKKAMIDDPERDGITDVSTSTLVASLLEVITLEKTAGTSKPVETSGSSNKSSKSSNSIGESLLNIGGSVGKKIVNNIVSNKGTVKTSGTNDMVKQAVDKDSDNVLNVRIIEDYTLPFKVTDGEVAKQILRTLRASANDPATKNAVKQAARLKKQKALTKEFNEAQDMQDNIRRTADAVEGISTGKGGAGGTGDQHLVGAKNSERAGSGLFGLLAKMASIIPVITGFMSIKEGFESFFDIFRKQDDDGSEDGVANSADRALSFRDSRAYTTMGIKTFKTVKDFIGGSKKLGAKGAKGLFNLGVKAFKRGGSVKDIGKDMAKKKAKDISAKLAAKGSNASKLIVGLPKLFKGNFGDILDTIIGKCPKFISGPVRSYMSSKGAKSMIGRVSKLLGGIVGGFTKSFGRIVKKGLKTSVPGVGLTLAIIQAGWSFYEGFVKTRLWLNRDVSMLEVDTRTFVGIAKAMWDCLPEILAGLCALLPGAGTVMSLVVTAVSIYLQEQYGGFEQFLEDLGFREVETEYYNALNQRIDKATADKIKSEGGRVIERKVEKKEKDDRSFLQRVLGVKKKSERKSASEAPNPQNGYGAYRPTSVSTVNNNSYAPSQKLKDYGAARAKDARELKEIESLALTSFGKMKFKEPLDGASDRVIVSAFGPRKLPGQALRNHNGIDFRADLGDKVYAMTEGTISHAGWLDGGAGNTIKIDHPDGTQTSYYHLSKVQAKVGDSVNAGDLVGAVGGTGGKGYTPHLHLGLKNKKGQWIDPMLQMGLNPEHLKIPNSPENDSWKQRNSSYVNNYSEYITSLAAKRVQQEHENAGSLPEKGGANDSPTSPYSPKPATPNKSTATVTRSSAEERLLRERVAALEKASAEKDAKLAKTMETMTMLLAKIVENTNISSNNNMNEALMLSQ